MKSTEKEARELLRRAWVVLNIVEPNAPITDKALDFLTTSETTDLERLVGWLGGVTEVSCDGQKQKP